jgi:hypothetical protein
MSLTPPSAADVEPREDGDGEPAPDDSADDEDTAAKTTGRPKLSIPESIKTPAEIKAFLDEHVFGGTVSMSEEDRTARERSEDPALKERWFGLLHPACFLRGVYDFFQMALLLYLAWRLPNRLAFEKMQVGVELLIDLLIDLSVWVDMYLSTHMFYYNKKTKILVYDRQIIKRRYMMSWFFIDLFSVLPVDQCLFLVGNLLISYEYPVAGYRCIGWGVAARMLRLVRVLRLARLPELIRVDMLVALLYRGLKKFGTTKLQVQFIFEILTLVFVMLGISHLLGCVWLLMGRDALFRATTPEGWLIAEYNQGDIPKTKDYVSCIGEDFDEARWNSVHGSSCNHTYECDPVPAHAPYDVDCDWLEDARSVPDAVGEGHRIGASEMTQYVNSLYYALMTVSTVGYGDILPVTMSERSFTMVAIVIGAFLYAYIIGDFNTIIKNMAGNKHKFEQKMQMVNDFMFYIDAPLDLRETVQEFFDFKHENYQDVNIAEELPTRLQSELIKHRYAHLIAKVPLFKGLRDGTVTEICLRMKQQTVSPNTRIMTKGEQHNELLILQRGTAEQVGSSNVFLPGSFFGEMQFLQIDECRTISIQSLQYCDIASLAPMDMADILTYHVGLKQRFETCVVL